MANYIEKSPGWCKKFAGWNQLCLSPPPTALLSICSYTLHSEILASLNFNKNKILFHGFKNIHTLKCCSGNFRYNHMSTLLEKHQIDIWMYGYSQIQGTRSEKDGELRDKSVPYFQYKSRPCPLDWRITIHSNVDLLFFQQSWQI